MPIRSTRRFLGLLFGRETVSATGALVPALDDALIAPDAVDRGFCATFRAWFVVPFHACCAPSSKSSPVSKSSSAGFRPVCGSGLHLPSRSNQNRPQVRQIASPGSPLAKIVACPQVSQRSGGSGCFGFLLAGGFSIACAYSSRRSAYFGFPGSLTTRRANAAGLRMFAMLAALCRSHE